MIDDDKEMVKCIFCGKRFPIKRHKFVCTRKECKKEYDKLYNQDYKILKDKLK